MKRGLLPRNRRALISHQLYLRNLWWLLTAGTPAPVLKMIWQDKKQLGPRKYSQPGSDFISGMHLLTVLKMAATQHVARETASIRTIADSCCHPPQAQTFWPAPACLFLLTNAVCLRVFGAICRVSRVQTDHLLYSLTSFQEANWEDNLKSARIHRVF